jgi:hypothetical protein
MKDVGEPIGVGTAQISGLRLIAEHEGTYYKVARFQWSNSDASLYVLPYVPVGGTAYAGIMKIPDHDQGASNFDYARQLEGDHPKLSLHEYGRCHASVGDKQTNPVWGRQLHHEGGGHIATIECCAPEGLPTIQHPSGPPEVDLVMEADGTGWHGLRVPYASMSTRMPLAVIPCT